MHQGRRDAIKWAIDFRMERDVSGRSSWDDLAIVLNRAKFSQELPYVIQVIKDRRPAAPLHHQQIVYSAFWCTISQALPSDTQGSIF